MAGASRNEFSRYQKEVLQVQQGSRYPALYGLKSAKD